MKNNINTKIGATLLSAAILAGTAVIPMTNAAALDASAKTSARIAAKPSMKISAHVQDLGWMDPVEAQEGNVVGTFWQSRRVEAMKFDLRSCPDVTLNIRAHIQDYGDRDFIVTAADYDKLVGTQWEAKRMEAVTITSNGLHEKGYKLQYRAHVQDYGWLDWVEEGQMGGTRWESKRVEAIETRIVPIEEEVITSTKLDYIKANSTNTEIALTLNADPNQYYYTITDKDGNTISATTIPNTKEKQMVLSVATSDLTAGEKYTVTTKDSSEKEIDKRTFTYRVLKPVNTATIEAEGINAENVNSLEVTVSTNGVDYLKRTVELTLTDEDSKEVKIYGTIGEGLSSTIIAKSVSELRDGTITVSAKVYDEEGNTTISNPTTTPATLLKGVAPSKLSLTSSTRTSQASATVVLNEIAYSDSDVALTNIYYIVAERGTTTPTVEKVVKEGTKQSTTTISASELKTGKAYNVYVVTENTVGTLSDVITVPVALDTINEDLNVVTDIKSNGDGTFTWKDDQAKVTGYIAQLAKDGSVVAEKTVSTKKVDFSNEIKECNASGDYTVNVIAVGDYLTINNSTVASGSDELAVARLDAPTITADDTKSLDDSTLRIKLANSAQNAASYKVVVIKGVYDKDNTRMEFDEKNIISTKNYDKNSSWLDVNVANYADGAYRVKVYAVSDDIKYLDSAALNVDYQRVTTKISNYNYEVTENSYKGILAPVEIDGFTVAYSGSTTLLNANGTWDSPVAIATINLAKHEKTTLKEFTVNALASDSTYKVALKPTYSYATTPYDVSMKGSETTAAAKDVLYVADDLEITKQITTKGAPVADDTYTVVSTLASDGDIAIVNNVLKMHNGTSAVEVTGSNVADIKSLVSKLSANDTFTITNGKVSAITINASASSTKTVALGNLVKDANLTIVGNDDFGINVSGNIGKGTITLNTANGIFNVNGLINENDTISAGAAGQKIDASIGTSIVVNGSIVNGVTFTGTGAVKVTGNNEITIPEATSAVTAISADDNKTIVFNGTQSANISITSTGTNKTVTVKTNVDSSLRGNLTVVSGKVNIVDAYISGNVVLTAGTIITDDSYTGDDLTITPVRGTVTITKDANANYKVSGNAKVTYTDAKALGATAGTDLVLDAVKDATLDKTGVAMTKYTFKTNNIAEYTLANNDTPKAVIEIVLTSGTLDIDKN